MNDRKKEIIDLLATTAENLSKMVEEIIPQLKAANKPPFDNHFLDPPIAGLCGFPNLGDK